MREQVDNIEAKVNKMYDALVGSELNPEGLIDRVKNIEEQQESIKKRHWMVAGAISVISFLISLYS